MPDAAPFHALDTDDQLQEALERSEQEPVVLFKHSTACPISARANEQMTQLSDDGDAPAVYRLVVQDARALSDTIAERFDIQHETPQAIVVRDGQPVFNDSHQAVTADAVREAARSDSAA